MYAIAFDLTIKETAKNHPKGVQQAYRDIEITLNKFGFNRVQGSLYTNEDENMELLTKAMVSLSRLAWFGASVKDIRAFKVEQWSDFNSFFKEEF
ncbi:Virulence-associated protein D [Moraxella lacunata]|uniref:Endoribonuclease VapD n=1 Tax=Moraxella lacunata TaxID=477 RepID=A0A378UCA1_MORLA|nr:virulence factor [Moraxella lacunata]STZ74947.1 Virulence-associated protein D [Moraxella lacunata]